MSLAVLKRKTQATYKISGKTPDAIMMIRGPKQPYPVYTNGGGFALKGNTRSVGGIGKTYLNSTGGSRMKPGTTDLRGWGGRSGSYANKDVNITWKGKRAYGPLTNAIAPATLSNKAMLVEKTRWKKTPTNINNGKIDNIYNNWVQSTNDHTNITHSSKTYTETKSAVYGHCQLNKTDGGNKVCAGCKEDYSTANQNLTQRPNYSGKHIGGKYIPPTPYTKFREYVGTADAALLNQKASRGGLNPKGYDRPFPFKQNNMGCSPNYNQGADFYKK